MFPQYRPAKRYFERLYEERAPSELSLFKVSRQIFINVNTVKFRRVFK